MYHNISDKDDLIRGYIAPTETIPIKIIMPEFFLGIQLMKGQIKYQHYFQPLKVSYPSSSFKC